MITKEENELLTRVEGDAPMGKLIRENYWMPFGVSTQLVAHAEPLKVRLLGKDYVAFRAKDGKIGFFDEGCPHRSASLALARNEGDGLRCIFHGWKFNADGECTEAPSQATNAEAFCKKVPMNRYPVFEGGGLLWVWLGSGQQPAFPDMPFLSPKANLFMTVSVSDCNWLQGVEGTVDSVHVNTLHQSWVIEFVRRVAGNTIGMTMDAPPRYEVETTKHGLRAAALRLRKDGTTYLRVTEYFMPYISLVPGRSHDDGSVFMAVPIDDHKHLLFFGMWSESEKIEPTQRIVVQPGAPYDPHNMVKLKGGRDTNYGQDRRLMAAGHFTGFGQNILEEDVVVQVSMGPIVDRTKEFLSDGDVAIVRMRRLLLQALREQEAGKLPMGSARTDELVRVLQPIDAVLQPGQTWREYAPARAA